MRSIITILVEGTGVCGGAHYDERGWTRVPRSMGLDEDTALRPAGDGAYEGNIVETWWTPRGPLGGYVMAIVQRGMELAVDEPGRQPRALTVHFLRPPEAGPITLRPTVERVGRSLTTATRAAGAGRQADRARSRRLLVALARAGALGGADAARRAAGRARCRGRERARRDAAALHGPADDAEALRRARLQRRGACGDRRLARAPRGAPGRRAHGGGAGRRLVPRAVATAEGARAGPHDRDERDVPRAAAAAGLAAAGQIPHAARA